jgi:hypothetical protein
MPPTLLVVAQEGKTALCEGVELAENGTSSRYQRVAIASLSLLDWGLSVELEFESQPSTLNNPISAGLGSERRAGV